MARDLFVRLVDELAGWPRRPLVSMNMSGEPLLHPQVYEFVELASARDLSTFISTNVTRLDKPLGERLINAGLARIHLCVDGATAEAHEAYRIGSTFEEVRRNCERFLEARERLGAKNPWAIIQTLLTSYSEDQIDPVLEWAASIGADEVFFKSLSLGTYTSSEQRRRGSALLPRKAEFQRKVDLPAATPCQYPKEQTIVYWDGSVGVCCIDYNNIAGLPRLNGNRLGDVLMEDPVLAARRAGVIRKHSICKQCASWGATFRGIKVEVAKWHAARVKERTCD